MIEMNPDEVRRRFGEMFSKKFVTMVDEGKGTCEIIEECSAKGTVEWDAVNRLRAGGIVKKAWTDGKILHMITRIGNEPVSFGPASIEMGGQALESVEVKNNEVNTTWVGIAGGGLGLSACLAQSPGVKRVIYPTKKDLEEIGGAHASSVIVVTPEMQKLIVGIDDTDTKGEGATWALALKIGEELDRIEGVEFLDHRIVQLNPKVENKTTNCVSISLTLAVETKKMEEVKNLVIKRVGEMTKSDDTALAIFTGIEIPAGLKEYGSRVKSEIIDLDFAKEIASKNDVQFIKITGENGFIGALGAISHSMSGLEAAALPDDPL